MFGSSHVGLQGLLERLKEDRELARLLAAPVLRRAVDLAVNALREAAQTRPVVLLEGHAPEPGSALAAPPVRRPVPGERLLVAFDGDRAEATAMLHAAEGAEMVVLYTAAGVAEAALLAQPETAVREARALAQAIDRYFTTDDPGSGFTTGVVFQGDLGNGGGTEGCVDPAF